MRDSTKAWLLSLVPGALAATLVGCADDAPGAIGIVSGTVVDANGSPRSSARVAVDELAGITALTDENGAFALAKVEAGSHTLFVLHSEMRQAAKVAIEVPPDGELALEPVMLTACDGLGDPEPCSWLEGKPVLSRGLIPVLDLVQPYGQVYAGSLDAGGQSEDSRIFLKLSIVGDFSEGGTLRLENPSPADIASLLSLTDAAGTHFYLLEKGVLDVSVSADPNGYTYKIAGTDLVFLYQDWNGFPDPTYTIEIGSMTLVGQAQPVPSDDGPG
jgi:hypothetical protein